MSDRSLANAVATKPVLNPVNGVLQRKCACGQHTIAGGECEGCAKGHANLQRRAAGTTIGEVPPIVHKVLHAPGHPLEVSTQRFMEERFSQFPALGVVSGTGLAFSKLDVGSTNDPAESEAEVTADKVVGSFVSTPLSRPDFSLVRVHADDQAASAASAVHAEAFAVGHHIVFGSGRYAPATHEGRHLLAHELTHSLQQQHSPVMRRKLSVDPNLPANAPSGDPATSLTSAKRFTMMNQLIQALCPQYNVDSNTGKVAATSAQNRNILAAGPKATGCCCLAVLTDAATQWTIEVSGLIGAQTDPSGKIFLNPTDSPVEFGAFTSSNKLAFQGSVPTAGHELCGHAALMELGAHPPNADRLTTDVHDPTVRIENLISKQQGVPTGGLRGLAASGSHRGESVDKITIKNYSLNGTEIPGGEQPKVQFAASYIHTPGINDEYVSIQGHSDKAGSGQEKQLVSDQRAAKVKAALITKGVPPTITKHNLPTVPRFTQVAGLSDTQPPPPPFEANQANWRRVEILMSGFPAGAQRIPAHTPTGVTSAPQGQGRRI